MIAKSTKAEIALMLDEVSTLLMVQQASEFRVRAYRKAAEFIASTEVDVISFAADNRVKELISLPTIGKGIANIIIEYVHTKKSRLLNRLRGHSHPEAFIEAIPGIGKQLAKDVVEQLKIKSLEDLELAAHDGRLDAIKGFGEGRLQLVKMYLASILSRRTDPIRQLSSKVLDSKEPSTEVILRLDEDYRQKAKEGKLHKISPSRFNPDKTCWLPIYHAERKGWQFTLVFSNTARAHELKKTNDWVIIYFEKDGIEGQVTVVTQASGMLVGHRVIKGREKDCLEYYRQHG